MPVSSTRTPTSSAPASTSSRSGRTRRAASPQDGRAYVLAHYHPTDVLDRVEATLRDWTHTMSRILMVTPYAPYRDGIAAYAVQQVKALRARGPRRRGALARAVSRAPVARPAQSAWPGGARAASEPVRPAHHPVPPGRLLPRSASRHEITPSSTAGLMVAFRLAHASEVVVHEFDDEPLRYGRSNRTLTAHMWRSVDQLVFHTAIERDRFLGVWPVPEDAHDRRRPRRELRPPHNRRPPRRAGVARAARPTSSCS